MNKDRIQITLKSLNNEIFVHFSLSLFTLSQRATTFFFSVTM